MKTLFPALGLLASVLLSAPAGATTHTVHIRDFKFVPESLKVHAGETVTFVNDDDEAHTVTAADKSFDSGGLDSRQSWNVTIRKAGTYGYFCQLHPYMKGSIIVLPRSGMQ